MDHRRETRVVIGRDLVELARLFGFRVDIGIGAADEPEHGWHVPLGSERSEVLARGCRLGFLDTVGGKVLAKRVAYPLARLGSFLTRE